MAETQETPKKAAPKKAAPKKAAAPKKEAAPKAPSFSKEEMLEAINVAVQSAVKAAAPAPAPAPAPVAEEKKAELPEAKYSGSENMVSVIATIFLVLGILGSIVLVILGIVSLSEYNSYSYYGGYHSEGMGVTAIIYGVVILLVSLLQFGMCKLYVNMSYRLTSIDKVLRAK